ncbi:UDP-N-acetylmuramoyl-L-alanine--D-glutamate ligase [Phaeovibrio sulfidiphilus]|uniref:UDP-N-acetylmuramoylalanine--D-glutamate ligase n=1 Tax=Phaeovibrio sulfidiphilus TaxID=1220600 RepID=A0A8J7CR89_9PROT|nr:UDP-N-acetylmuramoyl-L-alanine--D-glutamate ligase [Phaeovibrio sulfidiphilus]MBE1237515.1 UDP-N-acetylmuramoyl-L-alanine--D-glutamate ligase [Phaeovibrio sulfidiphilus]
MITSNAFRNRTYAVMGLGKTGLSAARALVASGARVRVWDDSAPRREAACAAGLEIGDLTGVAGSAAAWDGLDGIVWSPGIPHTFPEPNPVAVQARERGVPLFCDVELLLQARPGARTIAITGTNGKSTTTALIGHILASAGQPAETGGNLGRPVMDFEPADGAETFVLELSSYQMELTPSLDADIGILLNITPDHLARHGGFEGYVAAKARLFERRSDRARVALVGVDDPDSRAVLASLSGQPGLRAIPVSGSTLPENGIGVRDGWLVDGTGGAPVAVLELASVPALPGSHNAQNMAAAWGAARAAGLEPDAIIRGIRSFPGLAHRQELVATLNGIPFINDSKATNADASEKALSCYSAIYWIAGGLPKEGGIEPLVPLFGRIRHAFLIGACAEQFRETLDGRVPATLCGTLDKAVEAAARAAREEGLPGAVVLLSPAAASWDQFESFEHRGDRFRELVLALDTGGAAASPASTASPGGAPSPGASSPSSAPPSVPSSAGGGS